MRDEAFDVHGTGFNEADGARVGVFHATAENDRETFASGSGMFETTLVTGRNADEDDAATETDQFDGLANRFPTPGGFDGDVHLDACRQGFGAELTGQFHAPGERIGHEDFTGPGQLDGLEEQQADGTGPDDGDAVADADLGEVSGVDGDPERFEHQGVFGIERGRYRHAGADGHLDELGETAVVGIQTAEVEAAAEVRVALFAKIAAVTRHGGINGNERAQAEFVVAALLDNTGKLMTEDQRCFENGIADASVHIGVQVAATDAGGQDADEGFAAFGFAGMWNAFEAQIARPVEPGGAHGGGRRFHAEENSAGASCWEGAAHLSGDEVDSATGGRTGNPTMAKLTIYEIRKLKGKRQFTEIFTAKPDEAAAANDAGIDMVVTTAAVAKEVRQAAPNVFLIIAPSGRFSSSNEAAINLGLDAMELGGDAIYCGTHSMERIRAMADVRIPVIGHVGFIPYRTNWIGGPRAVGKTADEALEVYRHTKAYEEAGAIGVEMELVPHRVAAEITKRTSLCVISMGSGSGCDAQYLFAEDILGTNRGHVPRHAKQYVNLAPEYDRLRQLMTKAFTAFHQEVTTGAFPDPRRVVEVKEDQFSQFLTGLDGGK